MSGRRFTTIHDAAALRIHPDGSRVPTDGKVRGNKKAKFAIQDGRGNWIAQDAAGAFGVKRRRVAMNDVQGAEAEGEATDLTGVEGSVQDARSSDDGGRKSDGESHRPISRKIKRQHFLEDLSFLDASFMKDSDFASSSLVKDLTSVNSLPNPSSDLLKRIHYMASRYYHEMGQLEDVTREVRREKRRKRRIQLGLQSDSGKVRGDSIDDSSDEDGSDDNNGSFGEMEEDVDEEAGQHDITSSVDLFGEREQEDLGASSDQSEDESVDLWKEKYADQDMYKMFDGSALMAIGMLLQEYVAELVTVRPSGEEEQKPKRRRRRLRQKCL